MTQIYFIAAMILLILAGSSIAMYLFFRTYKKEMAEKKRTGQNRLR